MDKTLDIDELFAEINQRLPFAQQIQKDDPIYAGILLNKTALDSYVHLMRKNLDETLHQFTAASEQQVQNAEVIAEKLILCAGNNVEKQLDLAAQRWEERLKQVEAETEKTVRWATWLAWVGAILIIVSACVIVGSCMGNFLFTLVRHVK